VSAICSKPLFLKYANKSKQKDARPKEKDQALVATRDR